MKCIVSITLEKYGWAEIEAESDTEALKKAMVLPKREINFDSEEDRSCEIVEEVHGDA